MRSGLYSVLRYRPDKLRAQIKNLVLKGAHLLRRIDRGIYIRDETAPSGPGPRLSRLHDHTQTHHTR